MRTVDFTLVLACYNEGPSLNWSLEKVKEVLDGTRYRWEVICIDDASQDKTLKCLQNFSKKNPKFKVFGHKENVGRGGTVSEGMKLARSRVVGYIDVDLENSPVYIPEFIRAVDSGADVVVANRVEVGGMMDFPKYVAGNVYKFIVRVLLGLKYKDTEAGYKFFNRERILPILEKTEDKRWFFDTEIVARSHGSKLKIREIPVLCVMRPEKKSTIRLIPDSMEYIKKILLFRYQRS